MKALVVDDEKNIQELIKILLEEYGIESDVASTFKESLEYINKNYYDLALLDLRLPDGSGIELVDKLLEINPRLDIIFSSGYQKETCDTDTLIHKKRFDYISKPYPIITLLKAIRKTLDNK